MLSVMHLTYSFKAVNVQSYGWTIFQLPLKIDIIKHPNETDGKSTAVHAKLISPDDVSIYTYPCIPEYEDKRHEVSIYFAVFFCHLQVYI